jgi:hypothetical protein
MIKLAFTTAAAVVALSVPALAESWNVTEIATSGIKRASGTWTIAAQGDKVTGKADLQLDNGSVVTYKLDGKIEGGDDKKDCVWTGKPNETGRVFNGDVTCSNGKFSIRAGAQ